MATKLFKTVLVTGCGGDIGTALGRIIAEAGLSDRVIGADIHSEHPGPAFFDQCFLLPRITDERYFDCLHKIVRLQDVCAIVVGSEPELRGYYDKAMERCFRTVPVIMANREALRVGLDKLETAEFLRATGLPYPWTVILGQGIPLSYPCVAKSRTGSGSKSVAIVSREQVADYERTKSGYIWQEYLEPDDQEYTCGVYGTALGETRTIVFRRKLQGGFTGSGEVVHNDQIESLLQKIAKELALRGSINVQLRLTSRGPVVFEINPRFSSTVMFRHLLGFQDLVWSLQEAAGSVPAVYVPPAVGTRIYRGSREIIFPALKGAALR